eukprot:SAG11_NODE_14514_length_609_cov_1.188235_2_plen_67_part_00
MDDMLDSVFPDAMEQDVVEEEKSSDVERDVGVPNDKTAATMEGHLPYHCIKSHEQYLDLPAQHDPA